MRDSKLEQLPFKIKEAASKAISSLFRDKYKSKYENSFYGFKQKKRYMKLVPVGLLTSFIPIIGGTVHAVVMKRILDLSYVECMSFVLLFMTVQPFFVMQLLGRTERYKLTPPLFKSTAIFSNIWVGLIFEYVIMLRDREVIRYAYEPFLLILRHLVGASVLGVLIAKTSTFCLILMVWDTQTSLCILLCGIVIGFYVANLLSVSGYTTVLVIAYVFLNDKDRFSSDIEKYVGAIFDFIGTVVDICIYIYCIVMISAFAKPFDYSHLSVLAFNYVFVILIRTILLMAVFPIAKKMRPHLLLGNVVILAWGSTVGNTTLIILLHFYTDERFKVIADAAIPYVLFSALAGSVINNTGLSIILRTLNANHVTQQMINSIMDKLNHLMDKRNGYLEVMKQNRRHADINWSMVKQLTTLKVPPPFPKNLEITGTHFDDVQICCDSCPYDITLSMSPTKIQEFKRDLHKKLLSEMKAILARQQASGLISAEVATTLIRGWYYYLNLDTDPENKIESLNKFFKNTCFQSNTILKIAEKLEMVGFNTAAKKMAKSRTWLQKACHFIQTHRVTKFVSYMLILMCTMEAIASLGRAFFARFVYFSFTCYHVALVYFILDFIISVTPSVTVIACKSELLLYFTALWNIMQFLALLLMFVEIYIAYTYYEYYMGIIVDDTKYTYFYYARCLRFIRMIQVFIGAIPRMAAMLKTQADLSTAFGYELAKALKECYDELLMIMERIVENGDMREHFMARVTNDRMLLFTFILELQMEIPWLAPTIKSKQIINSTRCALIEALHTMKYSGSMEGPEFNQIHSMIIGKKRSMKILVKLRPAAGLELFHSVAWIDRNTLEFLYTHIQVEVYKRGDIICGQYTQLDGVHLMLFGLLKLVYIPTAQVMDDFLQNGQLPIIDYLNTTNVEKMMEEFIIPGNTIGELALLTGRKHSCTIIAETDVKMYVMKRRYLKSAFQRQPDRTNGVECRMWKYATIHLATAILMGTTTYQFYTLREIQNKLERSFVPDLQQFKIFVVTNYMEDIILLNGAVVDFITRDVYTAPCYLPRSVIKLCLAKCSFFNINVPITTKLMIIPVPDVTKEQIMIQEDNLAELMPDSEYKARFSIYPSDVGDKKKTKAIYDSEMELRIKHSGMGGRQSRRQTESNQFKIHLI